MEKITGKIEGKDQKPVNESTLTKFKIGGKTYSTFSEDYGKFNIGDNVDVEFDKSSDGKFNNITKVGKTSKDSKESKEEVKTEIVEDTKPKKDVDESKPMTSNDYWKNKEERDISTQRQIHRNGCINSSISFLSMNEGANGTAKGIERVKELAEDISKWIKEEEVKK